jgi:tetratricopeptide (TPR) repeat protein
MSANVDKLKKKAAEFEQKKQFDKALEVYLQIIGLSEEKDDRDVTVYNRVGDLYLRLNKADQAVNYYEQAVDLYTDGGYLNNAIALCNKILRHAPARHQIYYKLGKISAKKGFNSDAKKNFLEYADRMHRAGKDTDAFKALQEFADLCPGQDDIRLMLADQLARAGKKDEAIEQLQILHESLDAEGRAGEADATVQRIHTLDPTIEPRRSKTPRQQDAGGLVFLDVGASPVKPRPRLEGLQPTSLAPDRPKRPPTPTHVQPPPELEQLPDIELLPDFEPLPDIEVTNSDSSLSGLESNPTPVEEEFEPVLDLSGSDIDVAPLEGLESVADDSAFAIDPGAAVVEGTVEGLMSAETVMGVSQPGVGEPLETQDPLGGLNVLEDDRFYIHDADPLAGLGEPKEIPEPQSLQMEDLESDYQFSRIEPTNGEAPAHPAGFDVEDEPERAPELHEIKAEAPPEPEEERPARRSSRSVPAHDELEPEEVASPPVEEPRKADRARQPEVLKQSKLKVMPVRPTRPKKTEKVAEAPPPIAEPEKPVVAEKRPVNPFQRGRPKAEPSPKATPKLATPPTEVPRAATPKENVAHPSRDESFVDLADWLREDTSPRSYRMVAKDDKRVGDEQADFTDMLEKFKAGVAANVDDEDFDSHYDLGVAYREMGLIDEAIAEFQKALRGATQRIRAYEALGQCFIDRKEFDVAITILSRALREPGMEDEDLIGVLYLLGFASEESRKPRDAAAYYQRVFAVDIDFRDVSARLKQMGKAAAK